MSKYSVFKTNKGTELPLMNLKGKPYMQVAHRLVWFTEDVPKYETSTEFLQIDDENTIAKVTVSLFNEAGQVTKRASATKRETKKDFPDHTEKAETGALGRCLALLGYGTQFAIADIDEGNRLADSPVATISESGKALGFSNEAPAAEPKATTPIAQEVKKGTFKRPSTAPTAKPVTTNDSNEDLI